LLSCAVPFFASSIENNADAVWFGHVEPILNRNCYKCHGGVQQKAGLDLRLPQTLLKGGDSGPAIVPGKPAESLLIQRITAAAGDDDHMPPQENKRLKPEEVALISRWIEMLPATTAAAPTTGPAAANNNSKWQPANVPTLLEIATRVQWHPQSEMPPSDVIDLLIGQKWREQGVQPSDLCDDRTFVRRVFLDIAGRIPTRVEADAFLHDGSGDKRAALVDRLLAGSDFARHFSQVLDVVLMERKGEKEESARRQQGWYDYLESAIATNRPWNQIVYELIAARPQSPDREGAVTFLYERKNNYQLMAEAIAPVAFGVRIGCAQCHDHPLAHEIGQRHYWGLVAAFNRTANVNSDAGAGLAESAIGGFVSFTNLKKESQPALITLLSGQLIAEDRPAPGAKETDSPDNYLVPPPKDKQRPKLPAIPRFSRREKLAQALTTRDNPLLARAFVNRVWALMLGRGIVATVDEMDSRHPPSHPELLAWLAHDFEAGNYDIKRLVRTIALSRTYQLDSRYKGATPPPPELFARGLEKPLMAEVLWRSALIAAAGDAGQQEKSADAIALRERFIAEFPDLFATEYSFSLQQAMFLTNNPLLDALLKPSGDNTAARLSGLPDSRSRVREAFETVLGRPPAPDELEHAAAYLDARSERPDAAVGQLLWTLMTDPEFLLNH
jgi:hypothetical protein